MIISKIETIPLGLPLQKPIHMASRVVEKAECLLVKIYDNEGRFGIGEVQSIPKRFGDTICGSKHIIDSIISPQLIGLPAADYKNLAELIDKSIMFNFGAKTGVEMALFDLAAKQFGIGLGVLLGGKFRSKALLTWHINGKDVREVKESIEDGLEKGYKNFKLKLGTKSKEVELELVKISREAIGYKADICIDVNQSWTSKEAINFMTQAEEYNISYLEQPTPRHDIEGLSAVTHQIKTKVYVDEGIEDMFDIIKHKNVVAGNGITMKMIKNGRLSRGLDYSNLADALGYEVHMGAMMVETSISAAAGLHIASCIKNLKYGFGSTVIYLKDDIAVKPLANSEGYMHVPDGKGLGVELDLEKVQYYRIDR